MSNSLEVMHAGFAARNPNPIHRARHCSWKTPRFRCCNFWHFLQRAEPIAATGVSYRGTLRRAKIRFVDSTFPERDQQKWNPVLRPIALSANKRAHDLVAKPLTLWRIMRPSRRYFP
jgi:hypothetical protein